MRSLKAFTISSARPLPVILLADVSGSMAADGKIGALNDAVTAMLATFSNEDDARAEIHLAVVAFGGTAVLHIPLTPAHEVHWTPMGAHGRTPLGAALTKATALIEDRNVIPSRAYRPTVILVSDGRANDEWEPALQQFLASERTAKAERFALAIGADADHEVLQSFLNDPDKRVFEAHEGGEIHKFFRWVTMSVTSRSRSAEPNRKVQIDLPDLDDYGDF